MIFKPLQYDSGKVKELTVTTGQTVAKGDPLKFASGTAQRSDQNATEVRFVALEGVTTASAGDKILAIYTKGVEFEADASINTAQTQVNAVYRLKVSTMVVDQEAAGDVFLVTKVVGPDTDKKVRGYFLDRKQA